jgi:hypothetical protein
VYHQDLPLCKLKNQNYVQKHGICAGDLLMQRNVIIERFFQETLDDIWESLRVRCSSSSFEYCRVALMKAGLHEGVRGRIAWQSPGVDLRSSGVTLACAVLGWHSCCFVKLSPILSSQFAPSMKHYSNPLCRSCKLKIPSKTGNLMHCCCRSRFFFLCSPAPWHSPCHRPNRQTPSCSHFSTFIMNRYSRTAL